MTQNDLLRLKNDVINDYRNEKYYLQEDLRSIVERPHLSQREKVNAIKGIFDQLAFIDQKIAMVDSTFVIQQQSQNVDEPHDDGSNVIDNAPQEPQLNQQGQTHSE